jgi:hypothetical protein
MRFEVFAKHGNKWHYRGVFSGEDSRYAALSAGIALNRRVIGLRPEGSMARLFVHRFRTIPTIATTWDES